MNTPESESIVPHPTPPETTGSGAKWFFVTALIFLCLSFLMLAGRPGFLLSPVLSGHGLSFLILLLVGVGFSGIFGLVYWSIPRVFGIPLYSEKFVFLHYGFHLAGTLLALLSIVWPESGRGGMGMTFIACGVVTLAVNLGGTFRQPAKPDAASAFLASSVLWLLIAALLGLPFAEEAPLEFLQGSSWSEAWLVLACAGVLFNLPMGLALRITPEALQVDMQKTETAWYALAFTNGGLAWMFSAIAFGPMGFVLFCTTIYLIGSLLFLWEFLALLQRRTTPVLPWNTKMLLTSFSLIPLAASLLMVSAWQRLTAPPVEEITGLPEPLEEVAAGPLPVEFLPIDGATLLIALLAVGIPALIAIGFQLVQIEGKKEAGAERTLADQVLLASFFNYATGVLLLIPGMWVGIEQMLGLGSLFLLVGALGFLGNYFYSVRASQKPGHEGRQAAPSSKLAEEEPALGSF